MDPLSAAEAAEKLGVSERQVRRLAAAGELAARRVADRWLIDADAVRERSRSARQVGRPLSAPMAWSVLLAAAAVLGDGDASKEAVPPLVDRRVRHRLRSLLADAPPPEHWDQWLRHRAEAQRFWVHPGVMERLEHDHRLHPAGAPAVAAAGAGIAGGDRCRFYVDENVVESVVADYRAQPSDDGQVVLMVVPEEVPAVVLGGPGAPVPSAVALVDLLGSADARERHVAASALGAACEKLAVAAGGRD